MDSKQSPLALLAQTCSAIGSDSPNPKLLANIEKSAKSHNNSRDKLSPGSQSSLSNGSSSDAPKSSFKPYESSIRDKTKTPEEQRSLNSTNRIKTPKSSYSSSGMSGGTTTQQHLQQQQLNGRCGSNNSASSPRASPASNIRKTPTNLPEKSASPQSASTKESTPVSSSLDSPTNNLTKLTESYRESSYGKAPSIPVSSSSYLPGYPSSLPYPMDLMTASALMSPHHHSMLKAAAMNPYLNYARMKVPGSADSMMPVCRDPYCTGCALSPHMGLSKPGGACPAGCTQCDHPANKAQAYPSHLQSAAYAHAQLAAFAAASQLPYVCSWIAGDAAYCGKRFPTSDELLQHLRTHTSSMSEQMLNPAAAAVAAGLPPSHPLFQRTYPTPPLSPLSTARYHPYSKPSMLPSSLAASSLAGLPLPPHPSLAQYFSPYSLYGPRLGTPPSMHP